MRSPAAAARNFSTYRHSLTWQPQVRAGSTLFFEVSRPKHISKITFAATACRMASMSSAGNSSSTAVPNSKIVTKDKIYDEHWQQPEGTPLPKLKVFNSLTRSKVRLNKYNDTQ